MKAYITGVIAIVAVASIIWLTTPLTPPTTQDGAIRVLDHYGEIRVVGDTLYYWPDGVGILGVEAAAIVELSDSFIIQTCTNF